MTAPELPAIRAPSIRAARQRKHVAGDTTDAAVEDPDEPAPLLRIIEPCLPRIRIHGQPRLGAQYFPRILERRMQLRRDTERARDERAELERCRRRRGVGDGARRPDGMTVAAADHVERPPRQALARIRLAEPMQHAAAGRQTVAQRIREQAAALPLIRTERAALPLLLRLTLTRGERGFATDPHVVPCERQRCIRAITSRE